MLENKFALEYANLFYHHLDCPHQRLLVEGAQNICICPLNTYFTNIWVCNGCRRIQLRHDHPNLQVYVNDVEQYVDPLLPVYRKLENVVF
jgi:hypothetical protein